MSAIVCILIGHAHIHEIQTVTQLFFPGARFVFSYSDDTAAAAGYTVRSCLANGQSRYSGSVYLDGRRLAESRLPESDEFFLTEKRQLMLALFHALRQVFNIRTPWGALTGIRPSKLARDFLAQGFSGDAIQTVFTEHFCCEPSKARLALETAEAENVLAARQHAAGDMALYVSIPYCPSRCLYCSFNMGPPHGPSDAVFPAYLDALETELAEKAALHHNRIFSAVYIGGGTPTVLPEALLERLMRLVTPFLSGGGGPEFTVEAGRPDSITPGKLRLMREHGVTRVAVNPQTLHDETLRRIGRSHCVPDFYNAFEMARAAGFPVISTDIIAGLPGEGLDAFAETVRGVLALAPENVTVHALAVKRASRLHEYIRDGQNSAEMLSQLPDAVLAAEMQNGAYAACRAAGQRPYYLYRQKNALGLLENVGFSLPGCECLYNIGMMAETQTVIGAGAGAVSKFVDGSRVERLFNPKNPDLYIERMKAWHDRTSP